MLTIRTAEVGDAPEIAAIGSVAFRAVHDSIISPEIAASVVEQTYSTEALTACSSPNKTPTLALSTLARGSSSTPA